jgi:2,3-bisphosphoglycerate-independent phosphoglycerate mutase
MSKKVVFIIMDGWGEGKKNKADAIYQANTKYTKSLYLPENAAHAHLLTDGENVGLPEGQMGNSEVGHLNIGAGRIVYQDLVKINHAIADGSIEQNKTINQAFEYAKKNHKKVHFLGLVSDGGVHSSTKHLMKLTDIADQHQLDDVFVHVLTDGRDTDPRSGSAFVQELEDHLKTSKAKIASVCGRYYTMDRDKRWERIKKGYDLMVKGVGNPVHSAVDAIEASYKEGKTDEFIEPQVVVDKNNQPLAKIEADDVVFCFNYRTDRLREITTALSQKDFPEYDMKTLPLYYVTMTKYDDQFKNIHLAFTKDNLKNTLGEIMEQQNKTQIRIAETEKYAHVTFFFSGGREAEFKGEKRILIPSPKVATYDLQPEMSAPEVTEAIVKELKANQPDLVVLNFANSDMVGHTGVYSAITKAVETVDQSVERIATTARELGYSVLITADHGNSDNAVNEDGSPNTAHSMNPVPIFLLDDQYKKMKDGKLADIAPTILKIMELPIPEEMDGNVLV